MDVVDRNRLKRRLLVYGSGVLASHIAKLIEKNSVKSDMKVLGYIHAEGEPDRIDPPMVRHLNEPLVRFAKKRRVSEIVVAVDDRRKVLPVDQLLECRLRGIEVIDLNCFFERETKKLRVDLVTPSWMTFSDGFKRGALREYLKRGFDILASLFLLTITWPVMILSALAILLESGWGSTVFYRQKRVGRAQKPFEVLKFRSMIENAEQNVGVCWADKDDDRVTRVGSVIRKYRIDELPQILNVLRGQMSFVGPRPERPEFVKVLGEKVPYYVKRHYVKPGITGWAQLRYPYGDSDKDAMEKLQYDLYYVKNYSLIFDLVILLQTVEVVLFGKGAR
jgi:sugar transferase (PEP-CTERM system associated)